MAFTKNDQAVVLNRESLQYLANCIRLVHSLPDLLNDVLPSQTTTYSSYKVTELLNTLNTDLQNYVNNALGNLSHLKKEIVSVAPTDNSADEDTIYLVQDASGGYEQYLKINGVVTSLGSTSAFNNLYTKTESDAKFALLSTLNSLITAVGGLNDLTTTDKTSIVNAINELKTSLTSITSHTSDTDIHITTSERDKWNNKANNNEVVKKADIKTTLDENSTNDDVYGGKAIFDAIKNNCVGKETVLYEGLITATGTYTLSDDVNNYDFIVINHTHNSIIYRQSNVLTKSEISKCIDKNNKFLCVYGDGSTSVYTTGYFNNNNIIISDYTNENITSITGYKFGEVTVQNTITNPLQPISYSTDEQLTGGTWIDGKPIYRKSWTGTGNPSSFNHNIDSLGDVIKIDGCFLNTSSQWINFTGADNDTGLYSCRAMVTATKITFTIRNYNMKKYTLSVEYTKTTD